MTVSEKFASGLLMLVVSAAGIHGQGNIPPDGQSPTRLVARSGTVEIQKADVWGAANPGDAIQPGNRVRTGPMSSAAIEVGPGKIITLGERTEVQLRQSGGSSVVHLENGNMKVVSAEAIQVTAQGAVLETTERPVDLELGYKEDKLDLTVNSGAVRAGSLNIRGAKDTSKRTFTAGGRWGVQDNSVVYYPGVYFYPYVIYGNPTGGFLPQNVPTQGTVPPVVLNPTHPGYRPEQIVPPMTDPLRPPVLPFRR